MSTLDFHTAQRVTDTHHKSCQKCEKSKIEALGCLKVALVGFLEHPPLKTSRWRGLKWPNLNFEKKALVCVLVSQRAMRSQKN